MSSARLRSIAPEVLTGYAGARRAEGQTAHDSAPNCASDPSADGHCRNRWGWLESPLKEPASTELRYRDPRSFCAAIRLRQRRYFSALAGDEGRTVGTHWVSSGSVAT